MKESTKTTILTLDRFENGQAVFIGEHQEIILPKKIVPRDVKEGTIVHLSLATDQDYTLKKQKSAKELLNAILRDN